ncbi:MAG: gamma-glutamyltransferase [Deltaproteobacteria bacterium]|nr:gamma-glutamyltransferase [Deltaproteobacteria bacterium]
MLESASVARRPRASLALVLCVAVFAADPSNAAAPAPVEGKRAVLASAHPLATEAGREILAAGGNAVDAAVAVSFALSVVEPWSSGLGGGAFAVVHMGGETRTFDMREMAPAAATRDMFADPAKPGAPIPGASTSTAKAAGIPGLVRGMAGLHASYGRLPFEAVVAPALRLAHDGFPVSRRLRDAIAQVGPQMNADAQRVFMPRGVVPAVGERLVQADLAATLERIAKTRGEDFYLGETASELVRSVTAAGGIWTAKDLAGYFWKEREPVRGAFRGFDVVSMGPPSSGGLLLVQMLGVVERMDSGRKATEGWNGADRLHRLAETMKRAFAMRAIGLADPDYVPVDHERFIGKAAMDGLAKAVGAARRATPAAAISKLKVTGGERTHTTHFEIVTAEGDGVAVTQTVNLWFGNAQVAGRTGVVLNNEMDDFATLPGVPNAFGLVGDEGNAVAAGKRPLSSMTPTLVLKDGKVVGAFGSPGGSRIISTTFQVLLHVIVDGMDPSEALAAPRIHHQWMPDVLEVERFLLSPETRRELEKRGHHIEERGRMGNAMAIWRRDDGQGGVLEGAADPRGEGSALGL